MSKTTVTFSGGAEDGLNVVGEGANAWPLNFRRAIPHIGAVFLKDYKFENGNWQACPIGEGMVDPLSGKLISKMLSEEIPISIHIEYVKGDDFVKRTVDAMEKDLTTVRKWLG